MKKLKKIAILVVITALTVSLFAACSNKNKTDEGDSFIIGTGSTAGTYYPLGVAMAEIWTGKLDIKTQAESTGGSVTNIELLNEDKFEFIIVQNDIAYYAANGIGFFDKKFDSLMGMASLYAEPLQCITIDPEIKTIADLRGKRVAVGALESGVHYNTTQVLTAAGLTEDDLSLVQYLSFSEAANSLKNDQIDAAFIVAGIPTAAVAKVGESKDVFIVPIDGEIGSKLMNEYSFYTEFTIPAGTYATQEEDVTTITVQSILAVNSDVEEQIVYDMLDAMFNNSSRIASAHAVGKYISVDTALDGMSIPLHPGAQRYYDSNAA